MSDESLKGRLLIALPALRDPNFDRSIVLMLHHDDDGAVGVILNRASEVEVAEALPQWGHLLADPPVFFHGGPVGPSAAICLARCGPDAPAEGWQPVVGRIGTFDLTQDPPEVGDRIEALRVFSGYSGWRGGQLEDELEAGAWLVTGAAASDALSGAPDDLWPTVLRRQGGHVALLASFPPDPSLN